MMALLVYLFTIIGSFALGIFTTGYLGFWSSGEFGIINAALLSASVTVGVVAGKCLRSLSEHHFSFKAIIFAIFCYALPALALITHLFLPAFPGNILTVILKYLYEILFTVIGIIPSLLINIVYQVIKSSESLAAGIVILILFVVSTFEGAMLGESVVDKINPFIGTGADGVVEDEYGNTSYIYFR
ncbi:MAG: hypothetical protein LIP12_18145 [Clostridiales bacterium]|nr:hypothetical protein [Clostridiales bacterium]